MLIPINVRYSIHRPYWFHHGEVGDPKKFFESLDGELQVLFMNAIETYSLKGEINRDRGHTVGWEGKPLTWLA